MTAAGERVTRDDSCRSAPVLMHRRMSRVSSLANWGMFIAWLSSAMSPAAVPSAASADRIQTSQGNAHS
jgi:hypothetical protein